MEQRQALLVINPVAGTRSKQGLEEVVSRRLEEVGVSVKTVRTSGFPAIFAEFAGSAASDGYEMVISAGG